MITHVRTQQQVDHVLQNPAHALGLQGDVGAGKGFLSKYIADQLIGDNSPYCKQVDVAAGKFGIDDVRELQKFLTLTVPGRAAFKRALIIEHIDHLGHEAQNALLKTLEEPPEDTMIIVTYSRETAVLDTIHSRLRKLSVLPVSLELANNELMASPQEIAKAYHMSGGQIGLLTALLNSDGQEHQLVTAIGKAREILSMSRYQRLAKVDSFTKDATIPTSVLLDGLYRLLDAGYKQAVKTKSNDELTVMVQRMKLVEDAIADIDANVQAKLVLTRLFMEL